MTVRRRRGGQQDRERRVAVCLWRAIIFKCLLHSTTVCLHKGSSVVLLLWWLIRGTVQPRDTVVIHISHIYLLAGALHKKSLTKCVNKTFTSESKSILKKKEEHV